MLLFRHTQYASHCLNGERSALQLAEDEQHCGSRAVPAKCNCFFEQQHLCHVVRLFEVGEIAFLAGEPHGKATVFLCDVAHHFEVGLYLLCHRLVFGSHRLACIVWQLNEQKRIYVHAECFIGIGKLISLCKCCFDKAFIQSEFIAEIQFNFRVEHHFFLYHFSLDNITAIHRNFFAWICGLRSG